MARTSPELADPPLQVRAKTEVSMTDARSRQLMHKGKCQSMLQAKIRCAVLSSPVSRPQFPRVLTQRVLASDKQKP
jgi:hypothetical protein